MFYNLFHYDDPVAERHGRMKLKFNTVYPGKSETVIQDLLRETWSRPYAYEPFTQFKERPYRGNYVNVDEGGFRFSKNQANWPPEPTAFNVFVFGGSTTFGYGVSDAETVPSRLQEILEHTSGKSISIFNFARGLYYSTQERILFERLLSEGHIPSLAIFIDGVNDFYHAGPPDIPSFTSNAVVAFETKPSIRTQVAALASRLPLARLARPVASSGATGENKAAESVFDDPRVLNNAIERYVSNKRMIEAVSAAYSVKPIFVWQPTPTYKYEDQKYHLFVGPYEQLTYSKYGYPAMKAFVEKSPLGENFLWCADIQEGLSEPLYVDLVHYSAKFSQSVASCIAKQMIDRGLIVQSGNRLTVVTPGLSARGERAAKAE